MTGNDLCLLAALKYLPGELWSATAHHDATCPKLTGTGACSCDVEIVVCNLETGKVHRLRWADAEPGGTIQ